MASEKGQGGSNNPILNTKAIKTDEDFLEGNFDDLFILNKSGMMDEFEPSLHLVDKARKKLEEGAIQNVIREGEKGRERTITELENREIVSSVQQERQQQQKEERKAITLDILLRKHSSYPFRVIEEEEDTRGERLASVQRERKNETGLKDYLNNNYTSEKEKEKERRERKEKTTITLDDLLRNR